MGALLRLLVALPVLFVLVIMAGIGLAVVDPFFTEVAGGSQFVELGWDGTPGFIMSVVALSFGLFALGLLVWVLFGGLLREPFIGRVGP